MSNEDSQQDEAEPGIMPMAVTTDIPTINQSIIDDAANYPVVLINTTMNAQVGCASLAAAWTNIGTTSTDDYQVVVIRDYTMIEADHNAILDNAGAAASLTLTSTYYPSSTPTTAASATVTASGTTKRDFNFQSAETLVHDFNFSTTGCSRFLACGNKLTMGEGITITGTNVQVFAGGSSDLTVPSPKTAVVEINSGSYRHVFGGNFDGTYTGAVDVTIQGDTNIWVTNGAFVAAGGQTPNGAGSYSKVTVKGPDAKVREIKGCYASGDSSTKDIYIDNADMGIIGPGTNSTGTSTTYLSGTVTTTSTVTTTNLIVQDDASVSVVSTLTAGSVEIGSSATLTQKGPLKVTGDFSLAQDATYTRANADANLSIGGDLNVAGTGAALNLYKASATTAPVKVTVGGDYVGTDKLTVGFTNGTDAVSPTSVGGDVLFRFTTAANADGADYNNIYDAACHTLFKMIAASGNVKTAIEYQHPSYYVPIDPLNGLYSFTALGAAAGASETTGATHTEYRKYVYESGAWNVYVCDASGVTTGAPINQTTDDHPQPAMDAQVQDYAFAEGYMVRFDEVGKHRITACAGTNYDGIGDSGIGTASGTGSPINIDNKGDQNSSWAVLKQTNSTSSIYKAYLVMTTTLSFNKTLVNTTDAATLAIRDEILNTPMKLESAATGNSMMSNGYLPEGFSLVQTRTTGAVEGTITSDAPTVLRDYSYEGFTRALGEAMTITDVTDFVKANGYGKYYGSDIPTYGTDPDAAIAWRLVVLEDDPSLEYNRVTALQMGPFTNGNTPEGQTASSMAVNFGGYQTPAYGDFGGQVLFIGSDNLTGSTSGGSANSNVHVTFYPMGDINSSSDAQPIGTNDASTTVTDRPLSATKGDNWSQGQMDINGTKLTAAEVSHINTTTAPGAMGIDLSLLDVTDKARANTAWETAGGHNLYLEQGSSGVAITSKGDKNAVGYLDVIGMASDIEEPKFGDTIIHTDISMTGLEGTDIVAGKPVKVKATAENNTPYISKINGSLNTRFVVTLDEKLSNVRAMDGSSAIQATFHNYDEATHTNIDVQVAGVYNPTDHTVTFDFGTPYWDKDNSAWRNLFNSNDRVGEEVGGDSIEIEFLADTDDAATIDDPNVAYTNKAQVTGEDMILEAKYLHTPTTVYAEAIDTFDTYHNLTRISKTVEGTYADMTKSFTFAVTLKDSQGNYLPKGTEFDYKGGTLSGTGTAPADGTLTVGDNGVVTFGLKNDQFITITDLATGSIVVAETDYTGYDVTWHDSTWPTKVHPSTDYETALNGSTGDIAVTLSEGEIGDRTRLIDFVNTKTEIVPSGISALAGVAPWLMILAIILLITGVAVALRVYNYRKFVATGCATPAGNRERKHYGRNN